VFDLLENMSGSGALRMRSSHLAFNAHRCAAFLTVILNMNLPVNRAELHERAAFGNAHSVVLLVDRVGMGFAIALIAELRRVIHTPDCCLLLATEITETVGLGIDEIAAAVKPNQIAAEHLALAENYIVTIVRNTERVVARKKVIRRWGPFFVWSIIHRKRILLIVQDIPKSNAQAKNFEGVRGSVDVRGPDLYLHTGARIHTQPTSVDFIDGLLHL
jgi:hypothetical protein